MLSMTILGIIISCSNRLEFRKRGDTFTAGVISFF